MKRTLTICVLFAVLAALLAPVPGFCVPVVHPQHHACCASASQLSSSCCQPQTAPTPALTGAPASPAIAVVPSNSISIDRPSLRAKPYAPHQLPPSPSILIPVPILRT